MTTRRSLSRMQKLKVFEASGGVCHICGLKIFNKWDVEHRIPLALGGADDESNWSPAHRDCHAGKTKSDVAAIARAKRRKAKHLGIRKPSSFRKPDGMKFNWKRGRYEQEDSAK